MALVECCRFPSLSQALVARSALEAAGLHPLVFDEHRASVMWTEQQSLGGVRLMTPEAEAEAARDLLAAQAPPLAEADDLEDGDPETARAWSGPLGFVVLAVLGVVVGWPIAGFRRPGLFHRVTALLLTAAAVLAVVMTWASYSATSD